MQGGVAEADIATMEREGMPTGIFVQHPLTGEQVEVWVGNYVLMGYGEGAVMAVPAHDERDFAFAKKYGLAIGRSLALKASLLLDGWQDGTPTSRTARCVNSGKHDGLSATTGLRRHRRRPAARARREEVQFRLATGAFAPALLGCPVPIIHCRRAAAMCRCPTTSCRWCCRKTSRSRWRRFAAGGMPEFYECACPKCGGQAARNRHDGHLRRVVLVLLRYACPDNTTAMVDERVRAGARAASISTSAASNTPSCTLYARQLMRSLFGDLDRRRTVRQPADAGHGRRADGYRDLGDGRSWWINPADVDPSPTSAGRRPARLKADGQPVIIGGMEKMSKSKNNGVDHAGADRPVRRRHRARLFIMFARPRTSHWVVGRRRRGPSAPSNACGN